MTQERFADMFLQHYPEYNRQQVFETLELKVPNASITAEYNYFVAHGSLMRIFKERHTDLYQAMLDFIHEHFPNLTPKTR